MFDQIRVNFEKGVFPGFLFLLAIGAAGSICCSINNHRNPLMTFFTSPPYFFCGTWSDLNRDKIVIFCGVPLFGYFRIKDQEVMFLGCSFSCAKRATLTAPTSVSDNILIFMAFLASPPYFFGYFLYDFRQLRFFLINAATNLQSFADAGKLLQSSF